MCLGCLLRGLPSGLVACLKSLLRLLFRSLLGQRLALLCPQPTVCAAKRNQFLVCALLNNTALIRHENPITVDNRREAVRDGQ